MLSFLCNCHFRLDQDLKAKVADFGLTMEGAENRYLGTLEEGVNKPLPIRWSSLETLKGQVFTLKTDVVSSSLRALNPGKLSM